MENEDMISIIVPVFNAEEYLHRCIQSILNQTYTIWELILVDDGSEDSSGDICEYYSKNNKNIHVYHRKNEGAASARYDGMKRANGGIIAFIDADDFIYENYLMELSQEMIDNPEVDISIGGWLKEENGKITCPMLIRHPGYVSLEETKYQLLLGKYWDDPLWGKLYRKRLFNGFSGHADRVIGEDLADNWELLQHANEIYYSGTANYIHVITPYSITRRFRPEDEIGLVQSLMEICEDTISSTDHRIREIVLPRFLQTYADMMRRMILLDKRKYWDCIVTCEKKCSYILAEAISSLPYSKLKDIYRKRFLCGPVETEKAYNDLIRNIRNRVLYIYGAGRYAKKLGKILDFHSVNFVAFVISDNQEKGMSPDGAHEVIHMKELSGKNFSEMVLLIGMGVMNTLEVLDDLDHYPFQEILVW